MGGSREPGGARRRRGMRSIRSCSTRCGAGRERALGVRLDEVDGYADEGRPRWHMIRSALGIESFGVNAWRATEAGQTLIGEHDELGPGAGGHEELYLVLSGRATFSRRRRARPGARRLARVRQEPGDATERDSRRGRDDRARDRRPPRRPVLDLPVGALGRGAALLDDREWDRAIHVLRGAARRGSGQRERALQPRVRRKPGAEYFDAAVDHLLQAVEQEPRFPRAGPGRIPTSTRSAATSDFRTRPDA